MTRGAPRGGARGGMARGGPRFAAPMPGRFAAPPIPNSNQPPSN